MNRKRWLAALAAAVIVSGGYIGSQAIQKEGRHRPPHPHRTPTPTPPPKPTPQPPVTPTPTASATPTVAPTPTPTPAQVAIKGLFSFGGKTALEIGALNSKNVIGISVGDEWEMIEPVEGQRNWSVLDGLVKQVKDAGKLVLMRLQTGGRDHQPPWLFGVGVKTFSWKDPKDGSVLTIPVFWDEKYLAAHIALIKAAGERFGRDVAVVSDNYGNGQTGDWAVPTSPVVDGIDPPGSSQESRWMAAGWLHALMVDAGKRTVDALMESFPNALVFMALGPVKSSRMEPDGEYALNDEVIAYARAKYSDRLIVGKYSCNGNTCVNDFQRGHAPYGVQNLWAAYGNPDKMMPQGNPDNLTADQVLRRTFDNAKGVKLMEVYQKDVVNLPDALAYGKGVITQ